MFFVFLFLVYSRLLGSLVYYTPKLLGCCDVLLATCFHTGFLLRLFFDPEDGGDMYLHNIG
jgi:hypothetical protein